MTSQPLHPTRKAVSSYSQLQDGGLHTTPRCTVLPTLRNTLYQSIRRHLATNFPTLFSKTRNFKNFLGPFPGPQGLLPLIFEFPYSRFISPNLFPTFDPNSHFLLHGTAKRLNSTLIRPSCTTPRGAQPVGPRHTWPAFFLPHPLKRLNLTSTVTPTPLLYSFFSFSPKSMSGRSWPHTTY